MTDIILQSYGDSAAREDVVLNAVELLTAREEQIMNIIGKTTATENVHQYLADTLETAGSNAVGETADYTAKERTTPTRYTNIIENVAVPFKVSRTQDLIGHYHGQNETARQTQKGLMEWANSAEFDLIRSTLVSGVSGTVPKMYGLAQITQISGNYTAHNSGTVWSASILDALMKDNWDNSNGDVATDLYMGSYLKTLTDAFTQKTNVVVNNPGGQTSIVRTVTTYETSMGTLTLHKHRYIQQSSDTTARVLGIRPDKLAVAYLEKPFVDMGLARSGDYNVRAVVGKLTLECKNPKSGFFSIGFAKA